MADRSGDVRGGLGASPAHVDLQDVELVADGRNIVASIRFAGTVPGRQDGSRTQNVVLFVDLDADGRADHEVWAALADNGWGTSHRGPERARFGEDSGVTARPEGDTLRLAFPIGHLGDAAEFGWSVGTEWGTFEEVSAGTTAQDFAPDAGAAAFPG